MTVVRKIVPDFSAYPHLVVIYLGLQVRTLSGMKTALKFGPPIDKAGATRPDGLLHYENRIIYQFFPFHVGMRWYWRDMESLTAWAKSEPHRQWWKDFTKDTHGVRIWHETYFMQGGMEAIYAESTKPVGFSAFLPMQEARGSLSTRHKSFAAPDLSHLLRENLPSA